MGAIAWWWLQGCVLGVVQPEVCASNAECRQAFGQGSVCAEDGLCATAELDPRCALSEPADLTLPVDPRERLLVGTIFDHSSSTHVGRYRSVQLALEQANVNGGLQGVPFAVIHCTNEEGLDALTKEEASVADALWLADVIGVPAIVGPAASTDVVAVYNAVGPTYGTLVISPSATSPSLTPLDTLSSNDEDPGLLWRTAPPDSLQGEVIAADMLEQRTPPSVNVAVIYQIGAYGEGLQKTFDDAMIARGASTTSFPFDSAAGPADAIAETANGDFDEVLFVSSEIGDVVSFLLGAKDRPGYQDLPVFLTDAARNTDVLSDASSASSLFPQIRGTAPATPAGPVFDSFAASYAGEYGGEDVTVLSYTAHAFDAAWLVAYAHGWATFQEGSVSGVNLARGLRRVSAGEALELRPTSWTEGIARFQIGEGVNVVGASGALDYDPISAETAGPIEVWTIDASGAAFTSLYTTEP